MYVCVSVSVQPAYNATQAHQAAAYAAPAPAPAAPVPASGYGTAPVSYPRAPAAAAVPDATAAAAPRKSSVPDWLKQALLQKKAEADAASECKPRYVMIAHSLSPQAPTESSTQPV